MISKYSHKGLTWIDLKSPTKEELDYVIEEHPIPIHLQKEIETNSKEDIIKLDYDFIFVSLNIPNPPCAGFGKEENNRIIFIVNDNFVVTIHNEEIHSFNKFGNEMELDIIQEETSKIHNNKLLFAYLLKNLYLGKEKELIKKDILIKELFYKNAIKNKRLKLFIFLSILFLVATIISICL